MKRAGSPEEVASSGGVSRFARGRLHHRSGDFHQRRHDCKSRPGIGIDADRSRRRGIDQPLAATAPRARASRAALDRRQCIRRLATAASAPEMSAAKYRRSPGEILESRAFRAVSTSSIPARRASPRCGSSSKPAHDRPAMRCALRWDREPADSPAVWRWSGCCPSSSRRDPRLLARIAPYPRRRRLLNVGVGALSVEVFEVSSCAAPTLPSFDAPESVESGLLLCERLSAAPALAAAKTACAMEAAVAAVAAADIAAADACANAAAAAPAADAPAAGSLTAAAPCGEAAIGARRIIG